MRRTSFRRPRDLDRRRSRRARRGLGRRGNGRRRRPGRCRRRHQLPDRPHRARRDQVRPDRGGVAQRLVRAAVRLRQPAPPEHRRLVLARPRQVGDGRRSADDRDRAATEREVLRRHTDERRRGEVQHRADDGLRQRRRGPRRAAPDRLDHGDQPDQVDDRAQDSDRGPVLQPARERRDVRRVADGGAERHQPQREAGRCRPVHARVVHARTVGEVREEPQLLRGQEDQDRRRPARAGRGYRPAGDGQRAARPPGGLDVGQPLPRPGGPARGRRSEDREPRPATRPSCSGRCARTSRRSTT